MSVPTFPTNFELQQGKPMGVNVVQELIDSLADETCGSATTGDTTVIKVGDQFFVAQGGLFYISQQIEGGGWA